MRRGGCVRVRGGERDDLKITLLYQHSIVLAGALLTICDMTAFAALLTLYRSSARSSRRCCGAVVSGDQRLDSRSQNISKREWFWFAASLYQLPEKM